jgi:hypothetical protein
MKNILAFTLVVLAAVDRDAVAATLSATRFADNVVAIYLSDESTAFNGVSFQLCPDVAFENINSGLAAGVPRPVGQPFTYRNRALDADPAGTDSLGIGNGWTLLAPVTTAAGISFAGGPLGESISTAGEPNGALFLANVMLGSDSGFTAWVTLVNGVNTVLRQRLTVTIDSMELVDIVDPPMPDAPPIAPALPTPAPSSETPVTPPVAAPGHPESPIAAEPPSAPPTDPAPQLPGGEVSEPPVVDLTPWEPPFREPILWSEMAERAYFDANVPIDVDHVAAAILASMETSSGSAGRLSRTITHSFNNVHDVAMSQDGLFRLTYAVTDIVNFQGALAYDGAASEATSASDALMPEPATVALSGCGLLSLFACRRRKSLRERALARRTLAVSQVEEKSRNCARYCQTDS